MTKANSGCLTILGPGQILRGGDTRVCSVETRLDALRRLRHRHLVRRFSMTSERQASRRVSMRQPEGCATFRFPTLVAARCQRFYPKNG
jgi:hypothetical protein